MRSSSLSSALLFVLALSGAVAAACSTSSDAASPDPTPVTGVDAGSEAAPEEFPVITLPSEPQRAGDPVKGYRALVNEAYVPCGIPDSAYSQVFQPAPASSRLEGREGRNATLPYNFTAMTTADGVKLVTSNCLSCHAGRIDGKLVVGLGSADGDFTNDPTGTAGLVGALLTDAKEVREWKKWKERIEVIGPYSVLSTRGPNPADGFTAALFAHHDPKTMAWSSTPLMEIPPPQDVPVDVPPWWRMKKKTSMFYVGGGRGDHARIMMTASILCTSSVEESRAIDAYFADVRAYIASIEPPKYPYPVDAALADKGRSVFEQTCAKCHGTYGPDGRYPNRLVVLREIGTDPVLASGTAQFGPPFVKWFKDSFFGEISRLDPQAGYVAPPLDGIWATAPYLHNGSVPTIAALLDSATRPKYWTRDFDSRSYDPKAVGWIHTVLDHGKDGEGDAQKKSEIYDTTRLGYSNAGHTFGDALTPADRAAVIEYLKTL
ncbi:MAG: c-type cytochrome [Deltaproteobacteria bacterium]|nr:c-type cytochrome [Deltaproteobacteria bacterium]